MITECKQRSLFGETPMTLCHGSTTTIATPQILASYRLIDFGQDICTTSNVDQTTRTDWLHFVTACRRGKKTQNHYDVAIDPVANDKEAAS
jgi:hypothetical protein